MKIAIVVSTFSPYRGGMGTVAAAHARALAELGHDVSVFTGRGGNAPVHETRDGYRVERLSSIARYGNASVLPGLVTALKGFDAVFLHYPAFGLVEPILLWRLFFGRSAKFFLVYHMDPIAAGIRGAIFDLFEKTTTPILLRFADKILVSSLDYALAGSLGRVSKNIQKKFVELPLAVAMDDHVKKSQVRLFDMGEKSALFVGTMDRAHDFKGVPELLDAFSRADVPNAVLHLVGQGDLLPAYRDRARELGLTDRVRFHGSLSDNDLRDLYAAVDFLVLPSTSKSEAFGLVLLEAMASGKPVIASDLPGVRTVVKNGVTGWLVLRGNVPALTKALQEAFMDPERLRTMGEAARADVRARFGFEKMKEGLRAFTV